MTPPPRGSFLARTQTTWRDLWASSAPEPYQQAVRLRVMERNIGLPVRAVFLAILAYYFVVSAWSASASLIEIGAGDQEVMPRWLAVGAIRHFFLVYFLLSVATGIMLLSLEQFTLETARLIVYGMSLVDGIFLSALCVVSGGFDSSLYWLFLGLIARNAVSTSVAGPQFILNLMVSAFYVAAGSIDLTIRKGEALIGSDPVGQIDSAEDVVVRVAMLVIMTFFCAGAQVFSDRQRRAGEEFRELALRQQQLRATGRLAAEIAHQLKNPLGIINNAAFTLKKSLDDSQGVGQQIDIIREEINRSDQIITELMGYAKLSEGQIDRVDINEIVDEALLQVFPSGSSYEVEIERRYARSLPPLLAHKPHILEIFVNILHNARQAMGGRGRVRVATEYGEDYSVIVRVGDDGPGIPAHCLADVFEPYFTTKERGTGLGLAIVKHNTEIYDGWVNVQSELGKGAEFIVNLPAKTVMRLRR